MGVGSRVCPISHSSTPAAQERPSAIAHTIKLCPLPMSPHANTPASLVANESLLATLPRSSSVDAQLVEQTRTLGADEAHREQHELARQLEVAALDLLNRPSTISTSWARSARTLPSSSARKHSVLTL